MRCDIIYCDLLSNTKWQRGCNTQAKISISQRKTNMKEECALIIVKIRTVED